MPPTSNSATTPLTALNHYRLLGRSGLRVSPLCLGTMTFGLDWGWGSDYETSKRIFDRYAERGGNFIDTADLYTNGTSEKYVGDFIARDRERFIVGTKYTNNAPEFAKGNPNASGNSRGRMMNAIDASLKRLKTDYIDLYWLHIWDDTTPVDELMRGFDDLVRMGKVRYIAISDTPAWKMAQLNLYAEQHALTRFITTQVLYSLANRDVERDIVPMCREFGIAVLPWSPLAGGVLSGKYTEKDMHAEQERMEAARKAGTPLDPFNSANRIMNLTQKKIDAGRAVKKLAERIGRTPAQVALNWLLQKPGVTSIIIGARTLEQLDDNLGCLDFALDQQTMASLDDVSRIELGFPHDFMRSPFVRSLVTGGTTLVQ
jgi:aryl-alcohol dehydrogenase-like predicted oxidoreductase